MEKSELELHEVKTMLLVVALSHIVVKLAFFSGRSKLKTLLLWESEVPSKDLIRKLLENTYINKWLVAYICQKVLCFVSFTCIIF